jgi:putative toxin-antitoxin system antitoxin component (TIGR02293 family)
MVEATRIAEILGGVAILGRRVRSNDDLEALVVAGIPKAALRCALQRVFAVASERNRILYLVVPQATFKRRVSRLRLAESERTERLARVIAAAETVWDDQGDAREWLTQPHPELSGRTPIESALTELGARRVEEVLDRLEYGLPV